MDESDFYPDKIDARETDYLYVRASGIPGAGDGLFVSVKIFKNEIISYFKGEILSDAEAATRAENHQDGYFINMPNGTIMDSRNVKCFAKYANDAEGFSSGVLKNNAKISLDEFNKVCLVATRNIMTGEEIFCSYGKKYWKKHSTRV